MNKPTFAASILARKSSQAREYTVRAIFKRRNNRGPAVASVFLTRADEMREVPESRAAAAVRADVTRRTGTTNTGEPAPLTFGEAWKIATAVALKIGADNFRLDTGERVRAATGARVA